MPEAWNWVLIWFIDAGVTVKTTAYVRRAANAVAIARGAEFFGIVLEVMTWFHLSESIFTISELLKKGI